MSIITNTRKVVKLKKLEHILKIPVDTLTEDSVALQDETKEELFDLLCSCDDLEKVMQKYNCKRQDLPKLYDALCGLMGEVVKRQWLPSSVLAYRHTLDYVLQNKKDILNDKSFERREIIKGCLTDYFRYNKIWDVDEKSYLQEKEADKNRKEKREERNAEFDAYVEARNKQKEEKRQARMQQQN